MIIILRNFITNFSLPNTKPLCMTKLINTKFLSMTIAFKMNLLKTKIIDIAIVYKAFHTIMSTSIVIRPFIQL